MAKAVGIWVIAGFWLVLGAGGAPSSRPAASSATASGPASAPNRQQLGQAHYTFQVLVGQMTDSEKTSAETSIRWLGSDDWKTRERATEVLKGDPIALSLVRAAAAGNDPEVVDRCQTFIIPILEAKRAVVAQSLPKAVVARQAAGEAAMVGDLIALLEDYDPGIRCVSGKHLWRLTGQDFGYSAGATPDQRKQAADKARQWWEKNKAAYVLNPAAGPEDELALDLGGGVCMKVILIPPGKFMMGSPQTEAGRSDNEGPQHEVTISKPYYMGVFAVTQEQYERITGVNPSNFKGAQNPVETVSWPNAVDFCNKLSRKIGKTVRLPTEAEWEYACRAGESGKFSFGDNEGVLGDFAWHTGNSMCKTHPVGQKAPNGFGLYDMHGNVWQWCADWYDKDYANAKGADPQGPAAGTNRLLRGGSWGNDPQSCRSAMRLQFGPDDQNYYVGFRVVVNLAGAKGGT